MTAHERPRKADGACARVWELADEMRARTGAIPSPSEVAERFVAEGGNENTARTQYSKWRKAVTQAASPTKSDFERTDIPRRRLEIAPDGRLVVPADMRAAMLAENGGPLLAEVIDGELRLITPKAAIRKVRRMIAESDWGGGSVVDELIAERRAEALRDDAEALLQAGDA